MKLLGCWKKNSVPDCFFKSRRHGPPQQLQRPCVAFRCLSVLNYCNPHLAHPDLQKFAQ